MDVEPSWSAIGSASWSALKPDERGLVTAVVQHPESGQVAMGKSYVRSLIEEGPAAISAKIEEEAGELILPVCAEREDRAHHRRGNGSPLPYDGRPLREGARYRRCP